MLNTVDDFINDYESYKGDSKLTIGEQLVEIINVYKRVTYDESLLYVLNKRGNKHSLYTAYANDVARMLATGEHISMDKYTSVPLGKEHFVQGSELTLTVNDNTPMSLGGQLAKLTAIGGVTLLRDVIYVYIKLSDSGC